MNQLEYEWDAAESRTQIACNEFVQLRPSMRDAKLANTDSGRMLGTLKVTSTEEADSVEFAEAYNVLLQKVQTIKFTIVDETGRATDGTAEFWVKVDLYEAAKAAPDQRDNGSESSS